MANQNSNTQGVGQQSGQFGSDDLKKNQGNISQEQNKGSQTSGSQTERRQDQDVPQTDKMNK